MLINNFLKWSKSPIIDCKITFSSSIWLFSICNSWTISFLTFWDLSDDDNQNSNSYKIFEFLNRFSPLKSKISYSKKYYLLSEELYLFLLSTPFVYIPFLSVLKLVRKFEILTTLCCYLYLSEQFSKTNIKFPVT